MDTRKYLAELVGTFLFLTIGYASVRRRRRPGFLRSSWSRSRSRSACSPRSSQSAISRAGISIPRSRSPRCSTSAPTRPTRSATSWRRSSARSPLRPCLRRRGPVGGRGGDHEARREPDGCRGADPRDHPDGRIHPRHPGLDEAGSGPRAARHPAHARRHPLRHRIAVGRVGQPGAVDRVGLARR